MQTVSIRLSEYDYLLLKRLAAKHNCKSNQSDVIRRALTLLDTLDQSQLRGERVMIHGEEIRELVLV